MIAGLLRIFEWERKKVLINTLKYIKRTTLCTFRAVVNFIALITTCTIEKT